jgi:prepilin-type N-terminal cleavage/methylation domain-containing protein
MLKIVQPYRNSKKVKWFGKQFPAISLPRKAAFTLVEVMIAVGVLGVMMASLYGGFVYAFSQISLVQQNVRATQVLEEKMEVIRLLNWDQLVNQPGFVPTNFTAPFYASNPTNVSANSFTYTGTVLVASAPVTETYSPSLRMIQVQVTWTSGKVARQRQMTTFVSQYGMQNYVY